MKHIILKEHVSGKDYWMIYEKKNFFKAWSYVTLFPLDQIDKAREYIQMRWRESQKIVIETYRDGRRIK